MKVQIVNKGGQPLPQYKTNGSAGLDLCADINESIIVKPMERILVPTGIHLSIPEGYEGQIRARSGLALNHGIALVNGIGTIDSDYRGEVKIILINLGNKDFEIKKGDRIAQLVFVKYEKVILDEVDDLVNTDRGHGGFGHTGV